MIFKERGSLYGAAQHLDLRKHFKADLIKLDLCNFGPNTVAPRGLAQTSCKKIMI